MWALGHHACHGGAQLVIKTPISRWFLASFVLAGAAFITGAAWLHGFLPIRSDAGQALLLVLILGWSLVSLAAAFRERAWIIVLGVPFALYAPLVFFGGLILSCGVYHDCP